MGWILLLIAFVLILIAAIGFLYLFSTEKLNTPQQVDKLFETKYSTEMSRIRAFSEFFASFFRTRLSKQLNLEAKTIFNRDHLKAENILLRNATSKGWNVETYLELEKAAELNRLQLEQEWSSAEQDLRAGFIYEMKQHQHLFLMTEYIGGLYDKAKLLQEQGKDREYKLIEDHIEFMEGDFSAKQRLLQTNSGQDTEGSDQDTDSDGNGQ